MISSESIIRVRYDEVDKMGYVFHGNYAKYFHISRNELMRTINLSDKTLENFNIIMPVIEINIKYIKPVFYENLIRIKTTLNEISKVKLKFDHFVYNQKNELINRANSSLVFVDSNSRKPIRIPMHLYNKLKQNKHNEDKNFRI